MAKVILGIVLFDALLVGFLAYRAYRLDTGNGKKMKIFERKKDD